MKLTLAIMDYKVIKIRYEVPEASKRSRLVEGSISSEPLSLMTNCLTTPDLYISETLFRNLTNIFKVI